MEEIIESRGAAHIENVLNLAPICKYLTVALHAVSFFQIVLLVKPHSQFAAP